MAARALIVLVVTSAVPRAAWAQAPAIPSSQPPPSTGPEAIPSASAPPAPDSGTTPAPVPTFTPEPAPTFTPPPAPPPASGPYGAPVVQYQAPLPPPPEEKPPRDVRIASAHVDRVAFLPTAETHPAGTWFLSDYDVIVPQVGVAVSDRTQVSFVLTGAPLARNPIGFSDVTVKSVLARGYRYRLAAIGAVSGVIESEQGFLFIGRAGFVSMLCFDDMCRSSANLSTNFAFLGAVVMLTGVGFVFRVSELVSFLAEGATLVGAGPGGVEEAHGIGGDIGLRLARERWGLDFAIGGFTRGGPKNDTVPLPLIAFTYRFLP